MAAGDIIWADGFESGPVATTHNGNYDYSTSYSRVLNGGAGLRFTGQGSSTNYYRKDFTSYQEIIFGLAFQTASWGSSNTLNVITFHDGSTYHSGIYVATNGALAIARKSLNTVSQLFSATPPGTIALNTWYWIDGKIRFSNTNGNYEYRLNGAVIASGYTLDTCLSANEYTQGFALNASDTGVNFNTYCDDVYIMDNTGRTQDYLGDIRVYDIIPSGDGFHTGLSPSTGTSHYAMVDDGMTLNDADYLSTTTSGVMDTFLYTPLPTPVSSITAVHGIMHANRSRKSDAGTKTVRVIQRQGGVTYERPGSDFNTANSFAYHFYPEKINPATSSAWTPEEINTIELGIKVEV